MSAEPTSPPVIPEPQDNLTDQGQCVVLALDASESAEHAVNWYIQKVHRPGNKLVFVHVIELPEMKLNQARSMHMSPGVLASMWKEEEVKMKALEEKMKGLMKEKGLTGTLRTATGKPGEVICRVAEEENADMIVSGTRGMGKPSKWPLAVRRTILGSVSDYLVHHAHCPVIVCRHPDVIQKQRRFSGTRSRHSSGDKSRHASGDSIRSEKKRHASGDSQRSRHFSGDCFKTRLGSVNSDDDEDDEVYTKN